MNDKSPIDKAKGTLSDAADHASDVVSDAADAVKDKATNATEVAKDARDDAHKAASGLVDDAKKQAADGVDKASDKLDDLRNSDAADKIEQTAKDAKSFIAKNLDKHPVIALLLAGIVGVLVGRTLNRR